MTRTTIGKLVLLLAMVGALALAGCGGDDNGLSAEDQARITAADDAAKMAQAAADKAAADAQAAEEKAAADLMAAEEKAAADAKAAADKAAADKMAADAAIAEAKAAADAAKMAADAAQAEAEQAKQDAADAQAAAMTAMEEDEDALTVEDAVNAVWEATFTPKLMEVFGDELPENPTIQDVRDAITAIAVWATGLTGESVPNPNRLAGLEADLNNHFGAERPTEATAWQYVVSLREGGWLPATRGLALAVSPPADAAQMTADTALTAADEAQTTAETARTTTGDDDVQVDDVVAGGTIDEENDDPGQDRSSEDAETRKIWETVFTPHVEREFSQMIGANPTIEKIRMVILQLATQYRETNKYTNVGLESDMVVYFSVEGLTAESALEYFRELRNNRRPALAETRDFLEATSERYAVALCTLSNSCGGQMATTGGTTGGTTGDMMTGLDAILGNEDADVDGETRADAMDFALPEGTEFVDEARGIESFSARVAPDYGGFGDNTFSTLGLWAEGVAAFAVLSGRPGGAVMANTAIVGVPMDAPMGREGTAYWTGKFTGAHLVDPGSAFDPETATPDNGQMVGRGDSVMGDVLLLITFNKNEDAANLAATVDGFVPGQSHKHVFDDVKIDTRGGFDKPMILPAVTGGTAVDHAASMIDGQFYQSGQEGVAAGSLILNNGFDENMSHLSDPADNTSTPLVGAAVDGIAATTFSHAVDQYYIEGVFVAPE